MGKFFVRNKETTSPEDWQVVLTKPELHWKTGNSAKSLAYCWEDAGGFPSDVREVFEKSNIGLLSGLDFIRGDVEFMVPLPGGNTGSFNDILVLAKSGSQKVTIAVEGKVSETFDGFVRGQLLNLPSNSGRPERLEFLKGLLGLNSLDNKCLYNIRYQLLHRTASALIEAERFGAATAVMLVHSFSQEDKHIEDYQAFVKLFGTTGDVNRVSYAGNKNGIDLYLAWVRGEERFLSK